MWKNLQVGRFQVVAKGTQVSYDTHSTQVDLFDIAAGDKSFDQLQALIKDGDLYRELPVIGGKDDPKEEYGREIIPHVTILYGLENQADYFKIRSICTESAPVEMEIGNITSFRNDDKPYDVLIIEIKSDGLAQLHDSIKSSCENSSKFPEYKAHLTLAYVKKGACKDLEGKCDWTGTKYNVGCAKFNHNEGFSLPLPIGNKNL